MNDMIDEKAYAVITSCSDFCEADRLMIRGIIEAYEAARPQPQEVSEAEVVQALRRLSGRVMGCPELSPTECYSFLKTAGYHIVKGVA